MPSFTSFPTNYAPIIHTDQDGTPIEQEKRHTLSQGWLQMFTTLNQILAGKWERPIVDKSASVSKCSVTPYVANIYLSYNTDISSTVLTFPVNCYGILTKYDSSNNLVKSYLVNGNSVSIDLITTGTTLVGSLTT